MGPVVGLERTAAPTAVRSDAQLAGSAASDGKNLPVLPAALNPGHAAQPGWVMRVRRLMARCLLVFKNHANNAKILSRHASAASSAGRVHRVRSAAGRRRLRLAGYWSSGGPGEVRGGFAVP